MTIIEKIDDIIKNDEKMDAEDWVEEAPLQIDKLKAIINSDGKFFSQKEPMNVDEKEPMDTEYTLDVEEFASDIFNYLNWWYIPTTSGQYVDLWLI